MAKKLKPTKPEPAEKEINIRGRFCLRTWVRTCKAHGMSEQQANAMHGESIASGKIERVGQAGLNGGIDVYQFLQN